jgi:putative membrane-bound dehydrogenase-like protein
MKHPATAAAHAATSFVLFILLVIFSASSGGTVSTQTPAVKPASIDREYTLESSMLGYRGIGGDIDGVRNPTLWARTGETVRINIVNAELMVHDIALEGLNLKSPQILDKSARTNIMFIATKSDIYYCSVPGHRLAGMEGRLDVSDEPRVPSDGVPAQANGRPLNLDFEGGALDDWTAEGDAFAIVKGDVLPGQAPDKRGGKASAYWVSSNTGGGARKGTLTSVPFRVSQPYASFLVSGGAFTSTRVDLVLASDNGQADKTGKVIFTISGANNAAMRPVVVDLKAYIGKDIFIRLVDDETGSTVAAYLKESPWAHITFDHFRFHETRPFFPTEITSSEISTLPPFDPIKHAGLSAADAAKAMTVPKGFTVKLAAAEPDVVRPIGFALDDRGRLWVAEAHTYPVRAPEGHGKDRILIFEDTNGDGRLDSRKIFVENLNLVSGIEVGFGGVWIGAAPQLLFIPVKEGTDRPAGPPQVLLDGWGYQDTHEMLNTFTWGPDGWLYGTHGVFTHSNVGKPGAPDAERQRLNGAIWRFHPTKHTFEIFSEGTSNPWGLDFNDYGHAFTTACVIEHLYQLVPGARYKRQAGKHFNPYAYDDIKTVADHVHWVGRQGPHAGNQRSGLAGGGHAHAGAMIYLGGDNWPAEYRESIFMNNIHGSRTNVDRLVRKGSGYTATHSPDFLLANDSWSQMLNYRYGPDGSVFAIDWYDKNQCHSSNPDLHQKSLGRIFKISHTNDKWTRVDLQQLSSAQLVELQLNRNDWYVRHARRILQERGPDPAVHAALKRMLRENPDVTRKLRALWALHVTDGMSEAELLDLTGHESEYVRSWAVNLAVASRKASPDAVRRFAQLAKTDASPLVRLYLASALQHVPLEQRWDVLTALLGHDEDAGDQNIPLMVWYAAEPLVPLDMPRALGLVAQSKLPKIFTFTVQRISAVGTDDALRVLTDRLGRTSDRTQRLDLVEGISQIVGPR